MDREYPLVYVEWLDAESTDDWESIEKQTEDKDLPVIKTVGFLLKETDRYILVTMQVDHKNHSSSMTMKIPKGMIVVWYTIVFK